MRKTEISEKHIYCLEGNWNKNPRNSQSVKPILELLNTSVGVKYIYRKCNTKEELMEYLRQYTFKRYQNYTILYLAFHGRKNCIFTGNESITLKEIADVLDGELNNRIIHFGSCLTLGTNETKIAYFINRTGCLFISGYKKTVGYIDSTAFELLYLNVLQECCSAQKIRLKLLKRFSTVVNLFGFEIK